jgi:NADH-quinone oxidoreductase subunit F
MPFTPENRRKLDATIGKYPVKRSALLPALRLAQEQDGYISAEAMAEIAEILGLSTAQVHDTASFYTMFALKPEGKTLIEVCTTLSCALGGSEGLMKRTCSKLGIKPGETTADGKFTVKPVECLAGCGGAPAVQVNGEWLENATDQDMDRVIAGETVYRPFDWPKSPGEPILFKNVWTAGSQSIDVYKKSGGYANLKKYLEMPPDHIVDEVKKSGLRGRGGAGFPTGLKWTFLPKDSPKPRYLCVNADESEPGTYKDRVIIEKDPHQLIEASIVSAHAIRSKSCYIYIRGEFQEGARTLNKALEEAYAAGYVGKNILGTGIDIEVVVHRGAGSYECGEETACSRVSKASAASLASSRPFPRWPAFTAVRPSSTTSRPSATFCPFSNAGPSGSRRSVRRRTAVPSFIRSRATSSARAATRLTSVASPCVSWSTTTRAAPAMVARSARSSPAARRSPS